MNTELYSAYLYLNMSAAANSLGFKGAANWFNIQYQEEMIHFQKFYDYINSQGEQAVIGQMAAPASKFKSLMQLFEETLKHELFITKCINELTELAMVEKDHATRVYLQWFITEQIEEEENDRDIIGKLKLIGDNGYGLLMLDNELGTRVFTLPANPAV
ncbi:ferritin-1 [Geobacter sp. OR-1]|uniref:ferritin n=1 Tax=Geobacter sp. OR-1 TaxID=1266765 RepID=UPI000543D3A3|nr:ferritin [Geobacter sp. OR-1]GAM08155.1 ferritin-1 [Geobacter sp. OR-1]